MTHNILIFCSWLDTKSNVGIFFREQAAIVVPEYNPILVVFKRNEHSIKNFYKTGNYYNAIESSTPENVKLIEIHYPQLRHFPICFNKVLREKAVNFLHAYLIKKNIQPSLIHAQSLFDAGFWAYKHFKKFNIPYIITEHNQLSYNGVTRKKQLLSVDVLKNAKRILVVSGDKIRQFGTNGFFYDFINVGNLISDVFNYFPNNEPRRILNLITIGAFDPLKDQKTIFDALSLTDKLIDNIQINFTWIGYNSWGIDQTQKVNGLVKQYHFKNINLELIPNLERNDVAIRLNNADLFLFSSISEGMPVSILEALACGTPVFSSNCGGVDEVINEHNGKIYPVKDSYKLHQLLLDFLGKPNIYIGKSISEEAISRFGKKAFKKRITNIYGSTINDTSN